MTTPSPYGIFIPAADHYYPANTVVAQVAYWDITWTDDDDVIADRDGWNIFTVHDDNHPPLELERIDEMEIFADDTDAWDFVWSSAHRGFTHPAEFYPAWVHEVYRTARKALVYLAIESPEEFASIVRWEYERALGLEHLGVKGSNSEPADSEIASDDEDESDPPGICPTCGRSTDNSEAWSTGQCDDCYLEDAHRLDQDIEDDRNFELARERRALGEFDD